MDLFSTPEMLDVKTFLSFMHYNCSKFTKSKDKIEHILDVAPSTSRMQANAPPVEPAGCVSRAGLTTRLTRLQPRASTAARGPNF